MSSLCGIPPINTCALLFPFLYLFITSIYLLIKALLFGLDDRYALLSTIFVVTFSGLFYIFNSSNGVSWLIFSGMLFFWFKSFAIFLFIISFALFIIVNNSFQMRKKKLTLTLQIENYTIIVLSSFFLIYSYMLYFLPALMGFSLIFFYCLFSNNKKESFLNLLIYYTSFIIFYIFFDILFDFFFSWYNVNLFNLFVCI